MLQRRAGPGRDQQGAELVATKASRWPASDALTVRYAPVSGPAARPLRPRCPACGTARPTSGQHDPMASAAGLNLDHAKTERSFGTAWIARRPSDQSVQIGGSGSCSLYQRQPRNVTRQASHVATGSSCELPQSASAGWPARRVLGPARLMMPGEHGGNELAAAADTELAECRGQVLLNGVGRDEQLFDDLPGAMSRMSQDVAAVENR